LARPDRVVVAGWRPRARLRDGHREPLDGREIEPDAIRNRSVGCGPRVQSEREAVLILEVVPEEPTRGGEAVDPDLEGAALHERVLERAPELRILSRPADHVHLHGFLEAA